jgi:indolepyruvate ferredoxin oxidoreductase alpha subunit
MNVVYNKGAVTLIILDNRTTAMTGRQDHPATGFTLQEEETFRVDLVKLVKALGVRHVKQVNPYRLAETERVIKREANRNEPSVIISKAPCVLSRRDRSPFKGPHEVSPEICRGCRSCLRIACPAIEWINEEGTDQDGRKRKGRASIDRSLCNGCSVCAQICKFGAIGESHGK